MKQSACCRDFARQYVLVRGGCTVLGEDAREMLARDAKA